MINYIDNIFFSESTIKYIPSFDSNLPLIRFDILLSYSPDPTTNYKTTDPNFFFIVFDEKTDNK